MASPERSDARIRKAIQPDSIVRTGGSIGIGRSPITVADSSPWTTSNYVYNNGVTNSSNYSMTTALGR